MNKTNFRHTACRSIIAATLIIAPLVAQTPQAPPTGAQAIVTDAATLSDKFAGLARVMAGKYDWKPAQGVRSVGDVLNLIVTENKLLARVLLGTPAPAGAQPAPITDPAALQEALVSSYAGVRQALSALSASDLQTSIKLFGHDTTKLGAAFMVMVDQHEHLGQSIAYARSNGVVPPWSK